MTVNSPPEIRKNTQTFTIKLNPKARLIYSNTGAFGACASPVAPGEAALLFVTAAAAELATCVPAKAKKRKRNVPTNSPTMAIKWLRTLFGKYPTSGRWASFLFSVGVSRRFMKGRVMKREEGLSMFMVAERGGPRMRWVVGSDVLDVLMYDEVVGECSRSLSYRYQRRGAISASTRLGGGVVV